MPEITQVYSFAMTIHLRLRPSQRQNCWCNSLAVRPRCGSTNSLALGGQHQFSMNSLVSGDVIDPLFDLARGVED